MKPIAGKKVVKSRVFRFILISLAGISLATSVLAERAGEIRTNARDGQRYVWIPGGKFVMGCSPGDDNCKQDEKPSHAVKITRGFWIGQTETTVGAWKRYAEKNGVGLPPEINVRTYNWNPRWADDAQPIVNVLWQEAQAYCNAGGGRLPTEAEWEYAGRGGARLPVSRYGAPDEIGWYGNNSGTQHVDSDEIAKTDRANYGARVIANKERMHAVGIKKPNAWGLHDMLGNADEWVADWYSETYYEASEAVDPQGPSSGESKVARGAGFGRNPADMRVSFRRSLAPDVRNGDFGFRCVLPRIG
jgi:formylglycine-generating enzyme required for sulfatase activity